MLVGEYGERAVEARSPAAYNAKLKGARYGVELDVSVDEIADGDPAPDSAS